MSTFVEQVRSTALAERVFNERQLGEVLGGSDARRYGLVSRALKEGTLLRIKRGLYALPRSYRSDSLHPFTIAQAIMPGSYISAESALSYHGWIPEAVYTTTSISPGRKTLKHEADKLGNFVFLPLATEPFQFLSGVERTKVGQLHAFVAKPLRAIMDLVAHRKVTWSGLDWLMSGMRIDREHLDALTSDDFAEIGNVYKHKNVRDFIANLRAELLPNAPLNKCLP